MNYCWINKNPDWFSNDSIEMIVLKQGYDEKETLMVEREGMTRETVMIGERERKETRNLSV